MIYIQINIYNFLQQNCLLKNRLVFAINTISTIDHFMGSKFKECTFIFTSIFIQILHFCPVLLMFTDRNLRDERPSELIALITSRIRISALDRRVSDQRIAVGILERLIVCLLVSVGAVVQHGLHTFVFVVVWDRPQLIICLCLTLGMILVLLSAEKICSFVKLFIQLVWKTTNTSTLRPMLQRKSYVDISLCASLGWS